MILASCSSDSTGPDNGDTPDPPSLALTVVCESGQISAEITNSGGPMATPGSYEVVYENGTLESVPFEIGAGEVLECDLANLFGGATVSITDTEITASAEECVTPLFQGSLDAIDFNDLISNPLASDVSVLFCTYDINISNLVASSRFVDLTPVEGGLHIRAVMGNISAGIWTSVDRVVCVEPTGTVSIAYGTLDADIVAADNGDGTTSVAIENTEVEISDPDVSINNLPDWVTDLITELIIGSFASDFENLIADEFANTLEPVFRDNVLLEADCGAEDPP